MKLGKLQEIDIRKVWQHEQYDFSKWLANEENIQELGDALNLSLTDVETEKFVGNYRCDILCKDEMTGKVDRCQILLRSEVVSDSGNSILKNILEQGKTDPNATDNYSKNFNRFIELYSEKSETSPNHIFSFILSLLKYTILLPIDADDQETALTIFNTLNNRGLPLSDADIFKSHIYKGLDELQKKSFIDKWKRLEKESADVNESIQSLFYYHMFYLRAKG